LSIASAQHAVFGDPLDVKKSKIVGAKKKPECEAIYNSHRFINPL